MATIDAPAGLETPGTDLPAGAMPLQVQTGGALGPQGYPVTSTDFPDVAPAEAGPALGPAGYPVTSSDWVSELPAGDQQIIGSALPDQTPEYKSYDLGYRVGTGQVAEPAIAPSQVYPSQGAWVDYWFSDGKYDGQQQFGERSPEEIAAFMAQNPDGPPIVVASEPAPSQAAPAPAAASAPAAPGGLPPGYTAATTGPAMGKDAYETARLPPGYTAATTGKAMGAKAYQQKLAASAPPAPPVPVGVWIAIGLAGAAAVGTIVWAFTKKKKPNTRRPS
jgi:hypothetical protein